MIEISEYHGSKEENPLCLKTNLYSVKSKKLTLESGLLRYEISII